MHYFCNMRGAEGALCKQERCIYAFEGDHWKACAYLLRAPNAREVTLRDYFVGCILSQFLANNPEPKDDELFKFAQNAYRRAEIVMDARLPKQLEVENET